MKTDCLRMGQEEADLVQVRQGVPGEHRERAAEPSQDEGELVFLGEDG